VVEQKFIGVTLNRYKTNPLSTDLDITCVTGIKAAGKPLASAYWVESPDTLQAFTHGFNSNGDKIVQIALLSGDQDNRGILIECGKHICAPNIAYQA